MIQLLEEIKVLWAQKGMTVSKASQSSGLNKVTIQSIITGKNDNPNLQTVIDLAETLGGEIALITENSKTAIDQGDVSFYREALREKDKQIEALTEQLSAKQRDVDDKSARIEEKAADCAELKTMLTESRKTARLLVGLLFGVIISFVVVIIALTIIDLYSL